MHKCKLAILFIYLILQSSCHQANSGQRATALCDSAISRYIAANDTDPYYDTANLDYKYLKAFYRSDTTFFIQDRKGFKQDSIGYAEYLTWDSCIHEMPLAALQVASAYRFTYSRAFVPYKIKLTITNNANATKLDYILYSRDQATHCKIVVSYSKNLSEKQWGTFLAERNYADFWGMRNYNQAGTLDGDHLIIEGYEKGSPPRAHQISRKSPKLLAVGKMFSFLLKLSGDKKIAPYYNLE